MKPEFLKITFLSLFIFFLALFALSLSKEPVQAANSLDVVINEIAWMGSPPEEGETTAQAANDEWIELYNAGNSAQDLSGWILKSTDGKPTIELDGTIAPGTYFLLSRANETVEGIEADLIYSYRNNALGNNGEHLKLFDAQNNLIDEVDCSESWFSGDNTTKQTMERTSPDLSGTVPEHWQTSQNPGGTPKAENSIVEPEPEPESTCEPEICDGMDNDCDDLIDEDLGETTCGIGACSVTVANCLNGEVQTCVPGTPADEICDQIDNDCDGQIDEDSVCEVPEPEPEPEPEPAVYPSGIFINEFLPSPEGSDAEGEWIEFYNSNSFLVNLSGWSVEDTQGRTKSFTFPEDTIVGSYSFFVLNRPTSKITLNNDGEGLVLKNPLGDSVDSVAYEGKTPQGQSYARKTDGIWGWTSALTPGGENSFPPPEEPEAEPELEPESQPESQMEPETTEEFQSSFTEVSEDKPEPESPQEKSKPKKEIGAIAYPSDIVVNEILPSPTGPDKENEWIEVFNFNNFEVNLSNWQIQDTAGRTKTYTFSKGTEIGPQGFLVLSRPTTKITLNNDGDGLSLIQPDGKIIDSVTLGKAPEGQSYNRTDSGWAWSATLTPGSANIVPAQAAEEAGEKEEVEGATEISEKGLAAIGRQFPTSPRSLFVLLSALTIAILSGIVILILKKKIKTE